MINSPFQINTYSWTIGSITIVIDFVNKGIKPVGEFQTHNLYLGDCIKEIEKANLFFTATPTGETHTSLCFYKEPYLECIVNYTVGLSYNKDIFSAWVNGKMFGYSDEAIGRYIQEQCHIVNTARQDSCQKQGELKIINKM